VNLGLSTSRGECVSDPVVDSAKLSASSRLVFPPLPPLLTPKMLSSVSLDAPPAPVSSVFLCQAALIMLV
jgi:hypothetical protein